MCLLRNCGASQIEHHWPKAPHSHNANRGSTSRMFRWSNMVLACSTCNGFGGKASHMRWETDDTATLLNPCDDEPLCYFSITLEAGPPFTTGWIDPKSILKPAAYNRAKYTITRLKLNTREDLLRGRARTLTHFLAYSHLILEKGPDYEAPSGKPIRDTFLKILDAREPFLSPIRQILYYEPAYQGTL
ncbi:MAG: hypothetical protein JWL77_3808 [Chthonomonadaceae bacterium]|nr:hypothetical protein [Chthonomonadaceae bacterium]